MSSNRRLYEPLRFAPLLRPMAWGGQGLARFLGKQPPADVACGESWEVSDHPLHASVLATGPLFGKTLRQLMTNHREDLLGPAAAVYERFPWLVKWLDAHDWLSVQVHPDTEAVRTLLPGEGAKTEAWLVVDARPGSRIYAGLLPGIGPAELRAALRERNVADCLHSFQPRPGDFVFLPAGTVHAVGGGVLLAEIQQTSDATFRLHDWDRKGTGGRPRPLHIEAAFASIDWARGPRAPIATAGRANHDGEQPLIACPHFEVAHLRHASAFALGGTGRLQTLIVAEGQGRLANGEFVMAGDAWVLPAAMPPMALHVETPLAGLLCTLP